MEQVTNKKFLSPKNKTLVFHQLVQAATANS